MANTVDKSFEQQWSAEVKQAYQQRTQKLRDCVRTQTGVVGSQFSFPKLGSISATTKARNAELTAQSADHNVATATLEDAYASLYIDKLDNVKNSADYRKEYVQTVAYALARKADDIVIAALDAGVSAGSPLPEGALTEVAGGTGTVFESILTAARNLNNADVPMEDRVFLHAPGTLDKALRETEFTSADFQMIKALVQGAIDSALGFRWKMSTRLSNNVGSPNFKQNYAFAKSSIGLAIGADITTELNYIPQRVSHLAASYLSMGSTIIEGGGIVRVNIDES